MNLNFKNKIVLITGSTYGIGSVIANRFLKEGADVIITGRKKIKDIKIKSNLSFYKVDFEKELSVQNVKKKN